MKFWEQIARFEQREQKYIEKYIEAAGLNYAADQLVANESLIEGFVDAEAPKGVEALVGAVEKADSKLPAAVFINAALNAGKAQIEAQLAPLVAQGGALIPNVASAIKAVAAKLQAEANAL